MLFFSFDSLDSYVREQVLQTVAVICKRGSIGDQQASRDALFNDVTHLIASDNLSMVRNNTISIMSPS